MSRSYKKNGGLNITGSSDKKDRTIYNKNRRIHDNKILKECIAEYRDCNIYETNRNPDDKFVNRKVDRNVNWNDNYSWASDGGSYFSENLSSIRKDFEKEVWNEEFYEDYKLYNKTRRKWNLSDWDLLSMVVRRLHLPLGLSEKDFYAFFRKNENKIIRTWFKMKYGK
jgi:hypothetical protein